MVLLSFTFIFITISLLVHSSAYEVYTVGIALTHPDHPVYDPRTKYLYFTDSSRVYCYDKKNEKVHWADAGGSVGVLVPSSKKKHEFIAGIDNQLIKFHWDCSGKIKSKKVLNTMGVYGTTWYDEGRADKKGRLWASTVDYDENHTLIENNGNLLYITKENKENPEVYKSDGYTQVKGFSWDKSNKVFYYTNPSKYKIVSHSYDLQNGTMSNPQFPFYLTDQKGNKTNVLLTGLAIDSKNHLWAALFNEGSIYKINSKTGKVMKTIKVPAVYVTNLVWGGTGHKTLYVTASKADVGVKQKNNGRLFAVKGLGATGLKTFNTNIS